MRPHVTNQPMFLYSSLSPHFPISLQAGRQATTRGERVETVPSSLVVSEEEDIMMRSMAAVVSVDAEVYRGTSMPADH